MALRPAEWLLLGAGAVLTAALVVFFIVAFGRGEKR
jgi:hypothetical protein